MCTMLLSNAPNMRKIEFDLKLGHVVVMHKRIELPFCAFFGKMEGKDVDK